MKQTCIHCILVMFYYHHQKVVYPGDGLEKPTDRDQRSWVFLYSRPQRLWAKKNWGESRGKEREKIREENAQLRC